MISFNERYVAGPESNQQSLEPQSDSLSTLGDSVAMYTWAAAWQNQQNGHCAQWRHRSAWASSQSDQSLRCLHEETLGPQIPIERTAKTLIRLGGRPGWFESSLGAKAILLDLSWGGSHSESSSSSSLVASEINYIFEDRNL